VSEPSSSGIVEPKNLFVVGAAVTLLISVVHSQEFRVDLWSPVAFLCWYAASAVIGGGSSLAAGQLASSTGVRFPRLILYPIISVVGLGAYVLQLYVFLLITFQLTPW
jgi:hypothetical protein